MFHVKPNMEKIRKSKDLTKENFELVLRKYFNDENLKVEEARNEDLGKGDHYSSDMVTMVVNIEGKENPLRIFVKEPLHNSLRYLAKLTQPFAREVFWYMEAYPALIQKYPEIANLTPKCFLARSDYDKDYR